jgi:hypothetical protein
MPVPTPEVQAGIQELFSRYMWALDTGDVEALVDCFTADGSLESPAVGGYAGREQIRAFASRFARWSAGGRQMRHVISNLLINQTAPDAAAARCYLVVFLTQNGASRLLGPGRYECDVVREGEVWRFRRRVVIMDHDYTLEAL